MMINADECSLSAKILSDIGGDLRTYGMKAVAIDISNGTITIKVGEMTEGDRNGKTPACLIREDCPDFVMKQSKTGTGSKEPVIISCQTTKGVPDGANQQTTNVG